MAVERTRTLPDPGTDMAYMTTPRRHAGHTLMAIGTVLVVPGDVAEVQGGAGGAEAEVVVG